MHKICKEDSCLDERCICVCPDADKCESVATKIEYKDNKMIIQIPLFVFEVSRKNCGKEGKEVFQHLWDRLKAANENKENQDG